MQKVWSRVAQARSCNCPSCISHAPTALSRRTATTATRPRLTLGDLFTACYSATLATAAVLDMSVKQRRREQWDQAIREAKGEEATIIDKGPEKDVNTAVDRHQRSEECNSSEEWNFVRKIEVRPRVWNGKKEDQAIRKAKEEDQISAGKDTEDDIRTPVVRQMRSKRVNYFRKVDVMGPVLNGKKQDQAIREAKGEDQTSTVKDVEQVANTTGVRHKRLKNGNFKEIRVKQHFFRKVGVTPQPVWNGKSWYRPPQGHQASMDEQLELLRHYVNNVVSKEEKIVDPGKPFIVKKTIISEFTGECFEYFSRLPERRPKTYSQLQNVQDVISRLVARLLLTMKSMEPIQPRIETAENKDLRAEMVAKIASLSSTEQKLPYFGPLDPKEAQRRLDSLNKALLSIFEATGSEPDVIVAKICYNLLISPVPPNITSYNILLLNFTKLGFGDLAEVVADGFLEDSKLKPSEVTLSGILNHYISRNDHPAFYKLIQRMRGVAGDVRIKKRHIYNLYHYRASSWAMRAKVIHRNGFLIEKAPRDQEIFHKLVIGTCMFGQLTRTVMFARGMLREGYCLTVSMLCTLVNACISKSDLKNARALLRMIASAWVSDEARNRTVKRVAMTEQSRFFIRRLMAFCCVEISTASWVIEGLGPGSMRLLDHIALCRLARGLQLERITRDLGHLTIKIAGVQRRLEPYIQKKRQHDFAASVVLDRLTIDGFPHRPLWAQKLLEASLSQCLHSAHSFLMGELDNRSAYNARNLRREEEFLGLRRRGAELHVKLKEATAIKRRLAEISEDNHTPAENSKTTGLQAAFTGEVIEESGGLDIVDEVGKVRTRSLIRFDSPLTLDIRMLQNGSEIPQRTGGWYWKSLYPPLLGPLEAENSPELALISGPISTPAPALDDQFTAAAG